MGRKKRRKNSKSFKHIPPMDPIPGEWKPADLRFTTTKPVDGLYEINAHGWSARLISTDEWDLWIWHPRKLKFVYLMSYKTLSIATRKAKKAIKWQNQYQRL